MSNQLFHGIMESNKVEVEKLISSGNDVLEITEKEKWSYLHKALLMPNRHPSSKMVQLLINKGVEANLNDVYGNNALHQPLQGQVS